MKPGSIAWVVSEMELEPMELFMGGRDSTEVVREYVAQSVGLHPLAPRIVAVLLQLPQPVRADFLEDSRFRLTVDNYLPGRGRTVWVASPESEGSGSRCVVLKPNLANCREDFAHYVIAHELAHAYLRNGGWGTIKDPEVAADALAARWGFGRPTARKRREHRGGWAHQMRDLTQ